MKKRPLFFIFMAILSAGVLYVPLCSSLCPSHHGNVDILKHFSCLVSPHSFSYQDFGLLASFILPVVVLSLLVVISSLPEGRISPFFRPPRFSS